MKSITSIKENKTMHLNLGQAFYLRLSDYNRDNSDSQARGYEKPRRLNGKYDI